MPKHDFMTPKAIANRIKSKGLQKLRWYCQMCEKQCRDENGFKCHCLSESHNRQMQLFRSNPGKFMGTYSRDFEAGMLQMFRVKGKRVKANTVYQEYIANREHVHMNSTNWSSLSGFVQHLGRTGRCRVDYTEKGWYVEYIDRDPKVLARQEAVERNSRMDLTEEQRSKIRIDKQIKIAQAADKSRIEDEKLEYTPSTTKISLALNPEPTPAAVSVLSASGLPSEGSAVNGKFDDQSDDGSTDDSTSGSSSEDLKRDRKHKLNGGTEEKMAMDTSGDRANRSRRGGWDVKKVQSDLRVRPHKSKKRRAPSGIEQLKVDIEYEKRHRFEGFSTRHPDDHKKQKLQKLEKLAKKPSKKLEAIWIRVGLIVKVMNKKLAGGKYHNEKGTIMKIHKKFIAEVSLKNGDVLKLDQAHLQTVLPALNREVLILGGEYEDSIATLVGIDKKAFRAKVKTDDGVVRIGYDRVCKIDRKYK